MEKEDSLRYRYSFIQGDGSKEAAEFDQNRWLWYMRGANASISGGFLPKKKRKGNGTNWTKALRAFVSRGPDELVKQRITQVGEI
jgi:hypothetical protein